MKGTKPVQALRIVWEKVPLALTPTLSPEEEGALPRCSQVQCMACRPQNIYNIPQSVPSPSGRGLG